MSKNTDHRARTADSFEQQLAASARRLRDSQAANLHIPASPQVPASPSPTASPQTPCPPQVTAPQATASSQAASIQHPLRHNYWGWIATPAAAAVGLLIGLFINRPAPTPDRFSPHGGHTSFTVPIVAAETTGHSILDDGTDYSLLVKM